jgi:predicted dehydrogenase
MLRGTIIGLGKIAQTGHLPAFGHDSVCSLAEVVAGVDPKKESRDIAARQFPRLRLYEDIDRMFEKENVDFVDICATPQLHSDLIQASLQHRVHILCEKPIASSLQDARRITGMLRQSGTALAFVPCHQYRYSVLWQHFKKFVDETGARDGSLLQFNVFRTEADPGLHFGTTAWRTDRTVSGGGILADTGIHYLYLTLWMMGMPLKATARTHNLAHNTSTVEDTAVVILEYDKSIVEINLTWGADRRANSARLVSKRGSITYDGVRAIRTMGSTTEELPVPDASDKSHYVGMYVDLIHEFIDRMQTGKSTADWIEEAYQSVRLLHTCYQAADSASTIIFNQAG